MFRFILLICMIFSSHKFPEWAWWLIWLSFFLMEVVTVKSKKKKLTGELLKKKILSLVRKHGKVKLVSCGNHNDYRAQRIHRNGRCEVAYKSNGYPKYTSYTGSRFVPGKYVKNGNNYKPDGLKSTVEALFDHDSTWMKPVELQYGKYFRRKIKL
jgi:hypothetical protein